MRIPQGVIVAVYVVLPSPRTHLPLAFVYSTVVMQPISNVNFMKMKDQLGITQLDALFVHLRRKPHELEAKQSLWRMDWSKIPRQELNSHKVLIRFTICMNLTW